MKKQDQKKQPGFHDGQKVALLISARTEKGFTAVINGTHKGILYKKRLLALEKDDIRVREKKQQILSELKADEFVKNPQSEI